MAWQTALYGLAKVSPHENHLTADCTNNEMSVNLSIVLSSRGLFYESTSDFAVRKTTLDSSTS